VTDRRNVIVGLFVLFGLLLLGGLIVWFEGVAVLIRGGYRVRGHLPSARGIRGGKRVHMDGVEIGDVREVTSSQPERHGVWIHMRINPEVRIPEDALLVAQQSTIGDLYLDFQTPARVEGTVAETAIDDATGDRLIGCTFAEGVLLRPGDPVLVGGQRVGSVQTVAPRKNGQPGFRVGLRLHQGTAVADKAQVVAKKPGVGQARVEFEPPDKPFVYVPTHGKAKVDGVIKAPDLLPEDLMIDFREAMSKLGQIDTILADLGKLLKAPEDEAKQKNVWDVLRQFNDTAKAIQDQLEKPSGQIGGLLADTRKAVAGLQKTLANADKAFEAISDAGDSLKQTGKNVNGLVAKGDAFIAKLSKDTDEVRKLIDNLNALTGDLRAGKGTAGKLLTDDELHRALVTALEDLRGVMDNLDRLITLWRKEGLIWGKEGK